MVQTDSRNQDQSPQTKNIDAALATAIIKYVCASAYPRVRGVLNLPIPFGMDIACKSNYLKLLH